MQSHTRQVRVCDAGLLEGMQVISQVMSLLRSPRGLTQGSPMV